MEKMTAYEFIDLGASLYANAATMYAIFLTILSGYLVVAYVAGAKLSRNQVVTVNALYVITVLTTLGAMAAFMQSGLEYTTMGAEMRGLAQSRGSYFPAPLLVGIDLLLMFGSLKFMWDIRHTKSSD